MRCLFVFWCKFALKCGVTAPDFPTNWSDLFLDVFSAYVKSMALLILTREVCETRARARQERIESELTRDFFAFRLSFLAEKHQPYAGISRHSCTKNALSCNFSSGRFANVHFFLYLCRRVEI